MAITKQITQPPEAPQRSDPSTFADRADNFVKWLQQFGNDLVEWTDQLNQTQNEINEAEDTVKEYRDQTEAFRDEASAVSGIEPYDNSKTYNYPNCVVGSDGHTYRCLGTNVSGDNPVGSTTGNWKRITAEFPFDLYVEDLDVTDILYDDTGKVTEVDYEGGFKATFTYDENDRLSKVDYYSSDGSTIVLSISFTYDSNGYLKTITRS